MENLKEAYAKYAAAGIPCLYDITIDEVRPVRQCDVDLWQSFLETFGNVIYKSTDPEIKNALDNWKLKLTVWQNAQQATSSTTQGDSS